jgi:AcrR family transcriptional regulator
MPATDTSPRQRLSAAERRELVLDAATRAFARGGYAGTSTDAVAKEAGVSQPYVVRIFGTKLDLFTEVVERANGRIREAFGTVLAADFDPASDADWQRLGQEYSLLLRDREFLLVAMHGFIAGSVDAIGRVGRRCMAQIFSDLLAAGASAERARDFIARGMLLNVLTAMGTLEHLGEEPGLDALAECAYGSDRLADGKAG